LYAVDAKNIDQEFSICNCKVLVAAEIPFSVNHNLYEDQYMYGRTGKVAF
jgi:hypothetical protein